jgi:DNA-binding LytR/AlgR family response regulator
MNILLVDDEKTYLETLEQKVRMIFVVNGISGEIATTTDAAALIDDKLYKRYDVILLDIDMPDFSGIELASRINALKGMSERPYIIFVSGRDGLVFDALREQPFSFIRKSSIGDLSPCLVKIDKRIAAESTYGVKSGRSVEKVMIREIRYLEKQGNYVIFHTAAGEIRERTTIDEKEKELAPHGFIRCHIGYLVNPLYIREVSGSEVILSDGVALPLTKKLSKSVKQAFFDWMVKN